MAQPPTSSRTLLDRRLLRAAAIAAGTSAAALAAEPAVRVPPPNPAPPAAVVESFTRAVQPLLLNRCAATGCHGGRTAHEPVLVRGNAAGQIDRGVTLANIEAIRKGNDSPEGVRRTIGILAVSHPGPRGGPPLEPGKLSMLRDWLLDASRPRASDGPEPPKPNRFRGLLERAADPTPLWPPPQEPKGVVLKNDG